MSLTASPRGLTAASLRPHRGLTAASWGDQTKETLDQRVDDRRQHTRDPPAGHGEDPTEAVEPHRSVTRPASWCSPWPARRRVQDLDKVGTAVLGPTGELRC